MTHLFDTSAVLAHYLKEPGANRFDDLALNPDTTVGISPLTLYEFEARLAREGISAQSRRLTIQRYVAVLDGVIPVTTEIAALGAALREESSARVSAVDVLIAATALFAGATLVHRDAHFTALPPGRPPQEVLPDKG